jgi:hypothetical protein
MTAMTDATDPVEARRTRLVAGIAGVRSRADGISLERMLLIAGSVLMPTGLILILLGWYGAARTSYDFQQVPYLISGGILGAAMTVAGGFLYFGYWLTRVVRESQRQRAELTRLVEVLTAQSGPPAVAGLSGLVATATGSLVHRVDCALVRDKPGLRSVNADAPGLRPCKVCQPFEVG